MKITKSQLKRIIRESGWETEPYRTTSAYNRKSQQTKSSEMSSIDVEGSSVGIGDFIGFKEDIEQEAEIIEIGPGDWITVKAPPEGFEGAYIAGRETHKILADEAWLTYAAEEDKMSLAAAEDELEQIIMVDAKNDIIDDPSITAEELSNWYINQNKWISDHGLEQELLNQLKLNIFEGKTMKLTKSQLRRIVESVVTGGPAYADHTAYDDWEYEQDIQDDMMTLDHITDDIDELGECFVDEDLAEEWMDENRKYYPGVQVETGYTGGFSMITWPAWRDGKYNP